MERRGARKGQSGKSANTRRRCGFTAAGRDPGGLLRVRSRQAQFTEVKNDPYILHQARCNNYPADSENVMRRDAHAGKN